MESDVPLAIHLDGDVVAVQVVGDLEVFERLFLHDVAPVAGGVTDAEQHGLVLGAGAGECLVAPRVPVDRIVRVLQKIRTGFVDQMVWHGHRLHRLVVLEQSLESV